MEVEIAVTEDLIVDFVFTGEFTEEEAWDYVDAETQAMEEAGYTKSFEDFVETIDGETHMLEISQIWTKEKDG